MLFWLGVILLIAWITGFGVFHVASAAIHVLVALALLSIVMHFVRGKQRGDRELARLGDSRGRPGGGGGPYGPWTERGKRSPAPG